MMDEDKSQGYIEFRLTTHELQEFCHDEIVALASKMAEFDMIARQSDYDKLCDDCPPDGYETDKTRCLTCPRHGK